ncbi:hypothetical protein TWF192_004807 [Orbilia oligospora]|uniref:Uncharacterized protein n=1 Tax=Orbilia oligospora TaxID=2813651 RepID=A0A6G1MAN8_ORBOL|nr:hypothetical protein TWF191_007966 [Orbilia oligospora]KAF3251851.1 hypothetical protein TWF192_004807 [Orbilia oligospora]
MPPNPFRRGTDWTSPRDQVYPETPSYTGFSSFGPKRGNLLHSDDNPLYAPHLSQKASFASKTQSFHDCYDTTTLAPFALAAPPSRPNQNPPPDAPQPPPTRPRGPDPSRPQGPSDPPDPRRIPQFVSRPSHFRATVEGSHQFI